MLPHQSYKEKQVTKKVSNQSAPPFESIRKLSFRAAPELREAMIKAGARAQEQIEVDKRLQTQSLEKVRRVIVR